MPSELDSLPLLASPESQSEVWTSDLAGKSGSDFGVIEGEVGIVPNLCDKTRCYYRDWAVHPSVPGFQHGGR